jgi:hypothetical protein
MHVTNSRQVALLVLIVGGAATVGWVIGVMKFRHVLILLDTCGTSQLYSSLPRVLFFLMSASFSCHAQFCPKPPLCKQWKAKKSQANNEPKNATSDQAKTSRLSGRLNYLEYLGIIITSSMWRDDSQWASLWKKRPFLGGARGGGNGYADVSLGLHVRDRCTLS